MLHLRFTPAYCLALYCLTALSHTLHEFTHHLVGAAVCGTWGTMTFNVFSLSCANEPYIYIATYAGPAFTFGLLWVGASMLLSHSSFTRHFGFALIIAQIPWQRMIMPFLRGNDEYYASKHLFGATGATYWMVALIVLAICLPPLISAYRAIANKPRAVWFAGALILPFLLWAPVYALFEYLLLQRQVLAETIIGVPMLAIVNFVATAVLFGLTVRFIEPSTAQVRRDAVAAAG